MEKKNYIKELMPYVIILILVILLRAFVMTPVRVKGASMDTTLKDGEIMILNKLANFDRGDIVVVQTPNDRVIKRIVGLEGEEIEGKNGNIYINGKLYEEKYVSSRMKDFEKVKVPKNHYFVLGDNRYVSFDSRGFGPVQKENVLGKARLIIFPPTKIGIAK